MGAYENPAQIVDTQSGQHIRDMLRSIGQTALQYGLTQARKREKEEEERIRRAENNNTIRKKSILDATKLKTDLETGLQGVKNPVNIQSLQDDVDTRFTEYSQALQRFNLSQYNDNYAGSEDEQNDLNTISAVQSFSKNAPKLFENPTALIDKYKKLTAKYDSLGGLDPYYSDPYFQIFVNTQEGAYDNDASVGWQTNIVGSTLNLDYVVKGKEVKNQNAIQYYNTLTEDQKDKLFGTYTDKDETRRMTAEEFAQTYSQTGIEFNDIPVNEEQQHLLVDSGSGGYTFSDEHLISMNEMADVMNDTDGNPYVYGSFFSEIQDVNTKFIDNAEKAQILVNGKLAARFTENGDTANRMIEKTSPVGITYIEETIALPNLSEVENFAMQQGGAVTDGWELSRNGITTANAVIRKLGLPAYTEKGGPELDEFGNQVYYYMVKQEAPNEQNNYRWSGEKQVKISLLNPRTVINSKGTSEIWDPNIKLQVEQMMGEHAKRMSGYYTNPVIETKNLGTKYNESPTQTKAINPNILALAQSVVSQPSGNWSDSQWVTNWFNDASIDRTTAMSGANARLSLQEQINAYGDDESKLEDKQKLELANLKQTLSGLDQNAVYLQFGGTGDLTPITIGNAGVVANSIRSSFKGETEQSDFDKGFSASATQRIKDFTKEKYMAQNNLANTEFNRNSATVERNYQDALNSLKQQLKRYK